ncbi:MAG: hypothetical protein ACKVU1_14680 [bacterium]
MKRNIYSVLTMVVLGLSLLTIAASPASATYYVNGNISAGPSDRPELGAYKYTIKFSWNTPRGLSHWNLLLGVLDCDLFCDKDGVIKFPSPAGFTERGDCKVEYDAKLRCNGDPSTNLPGPLVKFEPREDEGEDDDDLTKCEPGKQGSGTFCFYSDLPPGPDLDYKDVLVVKNGTRKTFGDLKGTLPDCKEQNANEEYSWGRVKSIFR